MLYRVATGWRWIMLLIQFKTFTSRFTQQFHFIAQTALIFINKNTYFLLSSKKAAPIL